MSKPSTIRIDDVEYVRADSVKSAPTADISIVRCDRAGVFFGKVESFDEKTLVATISNARRVWYWSGAASLSQLAIDGTSKPSECKFPEALSMIKVSEVLEVIPCTEKAVKSLNSVKAWKQ
jgi:hypothetical protein